MPTQRLTATDEYCTTVLLISVEFVLSVELERPCLPARTLVLTFMVFSLWGWLFAGEMPGKSGGLSVFHRPCRVVRWNASYRSLRICKSADLRDLQATRGPTRRDFSPKTNKKGRPRPPLFSYF